MYAHGEHAWVRMRVGRHNCGLEHGKEAERVTGDHYRSWAPARYSKTSKKEVLVMRGKNGQGSQFRAHVLHGTGWKTQTTKGRNDNAKKGTRTATQAKPNSTSTCAQCTYATPGFGKKETLSKKKQRKKNAQLRYIAILSPRQGKPKKPNPKTREINKTTGKITQQEKCSKNGSTVCAAKPAKTHRKQHGKRQTTVKNFLPRKYKFEPDYGESCVQETKCSSGTSKIMNAKRGPSLFWQQK